MEEIIPNPFEDEDEDTPRWNDRDLESKVEAVRQSTLEMVEAVAGVLQMILTDRAHTDEHCKTFEAHAEAFEGVESRLAMLEALLLKPEAHDPQCECDQ